jgi:hypothetical protein
MGSAMGERHVGMGIALVLLRLIKDEMKSKEDFYGKTNDYIKRY